MADSTLGWYALSTDSSQNTEFQVAAMDGVEALGETYYFDLDLVSPNFNLDLSELLGTGATFSFSPWGADQRYFHGVLTRIEAVREVDSGSMLYRARLEPWFAQFRQSQTNIAYVDDVNGLALSDLITQVMDRQGFQSGFDYALQLSAPIAPRKFVTQYHESDMDFLRRWLEFEGAYYYFDQGDPDGSETVVFVDDISALPTAPIALQYRGGAAISTDQYLSALLSFGETQTGVPQTASLQNYNYRRAQDLVVATANNASAGWGTVMAYGGDLRNEDQASAYANLRAQALGVDWQVFSGESYVSQLGAGATISVSGHPRDALNANFLVTKVRHRGSQAGFGISVGGGRKDAPIEQSFYVAEFEALASNTQFRLPLTTPRPRISGYLLAQIDAEDGGVAYMDDYGRYKVLLPYDSSDHDPTKASAWVRVATSFQGPGSPGQTGFHFPLLQGTEVALAFLDGDLDQPIIAGVLNNSLIPQNVNQNNPAINRIVSQLGHELQLDDSTATPAIRMQSSSAAVSVLMGAYGGQIGGSTES
jgi:type VI secretion system secreted protein VgrG